MPRDAENNKVLEVYRITLLSNGHVVNGTMTLVLEIYRITLLSNPTTNTVGTIPVLEIYRITLLSNKRYVMVHE